jgi:hypothetical protein
LDRAAFLALIRVGLLLLGAEEGAAKLLDGGRPTVRIEQLAWAPEAMRCCNKLLHCMLDG